MSNSIVENVKADLQQLGVVRNEAEFCREWLGRGEGYLRTLRFTGTLPSAAALAFCADRLERLAVHLRGNSDHTEAFWAVRFERLAEQCRCEQEERLLKRKACGLARAQQNAQPEYLSNPGGRCATPQQDLG